MKPAELRKRSLQKKILFYIAVTLKEAYWFTPL